ncbi:hypothetical protein CSQ96_20815 [Janthinobacterium sp. BJB412]|nr:hypothetical protein CSQ96_20815 [Janthinobacterium sp. BJB412]
MRQGPYVLLGAARLAAVRRLLEGAVEEWRAAWGVADGELGLDCQRAWEGAVQLPAAPHWRRPWRAGGPALSLAWPAELPTQLQRAMFGTERQYTPADGLADAPAGLAEEGAAAAWQSLQQQLTAVAVPGATPGEAELAPDGEVWLRASGAVLISLRIGRAVCFGVLNHTAVQALLRQAELRGLLPAELHEPLAAVDHRRLLAGLPLRLPVAVGGARLGLGTLMSLGVGDVIRLDTAVDRPLSVSGPSGAVLFDGYLGLSGNKIALEVVRHDISNGVKNER